MKRIFCLIICIIIFCFSVIPALALNDGLDSTTVVEDLTNAGLNVLDYVKDTSDTDIYLITVREYAFNTSEYNLYLYLYNPSGIKVTTFDSVLLCDSWDSDGRPEDYNNHSITLVSSSIDNLLYKVKLSDPFSLNYLMLNGSRSYFIAGIQMTDVSSDIGKLEDYTLGYIYTFSGSGNNLSCYKNELLVVNLDVHQVSYLSGDSAKGDNYSNQINSVYFSIPTWLEKEYGSLYSVNFEYYKHRTMPMVLTDNQDSYNRLFNNGWVKGSDGSYGWWLGELDGYYFSNPNSIGGFDHYIRYYFGDQLKNRITTLESFHYDRAVHFDYLPIVFKVDEILDNTSEETRRNVLIKSDEIISYFKNYAPYDEESGNYINYSGVYVGKNNRYNGDLFNLDFFENYDKIEKSYTVDDTFSLDSFIDVNNNTFLHILTGKWGYVLNPDQYDNSIIDLKMIEKVTHSDTIRSNSSEILRISEPDLHDLSKYLYELPDSRNVSTYILRYAWSDDYYCNVLEPDGLEGNFLLAEETVYIDFDILSLSFKSDNEDITIIPVVSEPTDGTTGIQDTRPNQDLLDNIYDKFIDYYDLLKKLCAVIILLLGIISVYSAAKILFFTNNKSYHSNSRHYKRK